MILLNLIGDKDCSRCRETLPQYEYHLSIRGKFGLSNHCKRCNLKSAQKHYAENRDVRLRTAKDRSTRLPFFRRNRKYGIDFESFWAERGGLCEACSVVTAKRGCGPNSATVDHDHSCCAGNWSNTCGRCVRGLLCSACNRILGIANDSPKRLEGCIAYLRKVTNRE
jgi:hypothetical protein